MLTTYNTRPDLARAASAAEDRASSAAGYPRFGQLLILADDVKCKHGSTTGQLDQEALFYLRSRGIGEPAARSLLTYAFASEVLGGFRVPALRDEIQTLLEGRLPGGGEIQGAIA